ncbi:MAG TPA: glutathione S-transferase family protein [Thermodesulfobacteriota bacterium]|nr:glutathione S-transferase family protein [Thermodesulfobacteriota bacterium]
MPLILFSHPFASYCQKALIALYENDTPFTPRILDKSDPSTFAEFEALWPLKKFPLLLDGDHAISEATIIIEYLDLYHLGLMRMIPADQKSALEVRFIDRFFDNYVHTPLQAIVADSLREPTAHDPKGVADAKAALDVAYGWLERHMTDREWAAGGSFSLADCAAAPALFYADWVHPIGADFPNVRAYRNRLNARPSFARAIDEARPYRHLFPLGAPERD